MSDSLRKRIADLLNSVGFAETIITLMLKHGMSRNKALACTEEVMENEYGTRYTE